MIKKNTLFFTLVCLLPFIGFAQTFETMKKYRICTPSGWALEIRNNGNSGGSV